MRPNGPVASRLAAAALAGALLMPLGMKAEARPRSRGPQDVKPLSLETPEPQFPANVAWTLTAFNGKPAPDDPPSFVLDGNLRATGFAGCNTYSMTLYPVRGQKLAAGSIALTRKQCDKAVMLFERDFLVALHSLPAWSLDGSDLVIRSPRAQLRFRRGV